MQPISREAMKCSKKMVAIANVHPVLVNFRHSANAAMQVFVILFLIPFYRRRELVSSRTAEVEQFVCYPILCF